VVNLVLNKTFVGIKGHAEFGDTDKDDHRVYKTELTWGTALCRQPRPSHFERASTP